MTSNQPANFFNEKQLETQIITEVNDTLQNDYISKADFINILTPLMNYIDKLSNTYAVLENSNGIEIEYNYQKPNLENILIQNNN